MKVLKLEVGSAPYRIQAVAVECGSDLVVTIGGGERSHVGATALAVPRASLADASMLSATASVICVTGHKEDELARKAALRLATTFSCCATVSVGIHIDEAKREDVVWLTQNYEDLCQMLVEELAVEREKIAD
jgi:hypothetical protein